MILSHRVLAFLLFCISASALAGLGVSPGILEKKLVAGDNTLELVISNNGTVAMAIDLSTGPLSLTQEGTAIAGKSDARFDASPLIRFEQERFVIPPRRWKRIRAHLQAPNRGGGLHGMVYVRGTEANPDPQAKVQVNLRLVVLLMLTLPGNPEPSLQLEDLRASSSGTASIRVRNTGNVHLRPEGRLLLRNTAGAEVWSGKVITGAVLPGHERDLRVEPLPKLASGQYSAEVELTSPTALSLQRKLALVDGTLIVSQAPKSTR